MAELTLGLMLAVLRRHAGVRRGRAVGALDRIPPCRTGIGELGGRTVGLVGFGAIPKILAPMLAAMGCSVMLLRAGRRVADAIAEYRAFDRLLAEADIVSLHLPLTPETRRMIDAAALARMKPGAILINTARGGLVDQPALIRALESGRLAGAGPGCVRN